MNRRELMALAGAAVAASALPSPAGASRGAPAFTLYDPAVPASARFANAAGHAVAIQGDLVRQWRDGLGAAIGSRTPVAALVRWSDAFALADLLKESRRGASIDRVPEADGSLFLLRA
jgi:hypothetical protein